jgi:hypothetical protein
VDGVKKLAAAQAESKALAKRDGHTQKEQAGQEEEGFEWLLKAGEEAVLLWLSRELPRGSVQEARSRLCALLEAVQEEVPLATGAIKLMHRLLEKLDATPDPRPWQVSPGDLLEATTETWERIGKWRSEEDAARFLARFGDAMVRLERSDSGAIGTVPLDAKRVTNMLTRVARWSRPVDPDLKQVWERMAQLLGDPSILDLLYTKTTPPSIVALNLLADPERPLPILERVVEVPVLTCDGTIHDAAGYDRASRCFLAPAKGLDVPRVAPSPTHEEVEAAVGLILDELLSDFPFTGPAERAHALCLVLEQFVRELIDGPTPLYLAAAPTPGTGKSLLVDAALTPTLGNRPAAKMAEARDADEWRKRLTAKLRSAPPVLVIDNLRRPLDAGALAMTITAGEVEDRLLGVSEVVTLPVRCTIAATANNPQLSDEMARRTARIKLDAKIEFPERREGFRHRDLLRWARTHRADLIWAALTLARAWIAAGRPTDGVTPLGGFEDWSRVMGGILDVAGVEGFLGNAAEVRAETQDTSHGDFLHAVYRRHRDGEWAAREVIPIARELLGLGEVSDAVAAQRLGYKLRSMRDRPVRGLVLRSRGEVHGGARAWQVAPATAGTSPPSPPSPPPGGHGGDGGDEPEVVEGKLCDEVQGG